MSVLGLYQWDNTLFSLLTVPDGLETDTLIDFILAECSDLETLYPNPEVLKGLIGVWSNTQQFEWNKLYQTMLFDYNPIDNYDRTETRTLASQAAGTVTDGGTDTVTSADTGTDATTGSTTNLNQVKAFDTAAGTFTDKEKDTIKDEEYINKTASNDDSIDYILTIKNTLDEISSYIIISKIVYNFSFKEIAKDLNMSVGQVQGIYYQSLKKIKKVF